VVLYQQHQWTNKWTMLILYQQCAPRPSITVWELTVWITPRRLSNNLHRSITVALLMSTLCSLLESWFSIIQLTRHTLHLGAEAVYWTKPRITVGECWQLLISVSDIVTKIHSSSVTGVSASLNDCALLAHVNTVKELANVLLLDARRLLNQSRCNVNTDIHHITTHLLCRSLRSKFTEVQIPNHKTCVLCHHRQVMKSEIRLWSDDGAVSAHINARI